MYRIRTFNKISPVGLNRLDPALYAVSDSETDEDAILVRSAKLLDYDFPKNLLAISRAGAGVNNIPLDRCSEAGIVVFNTPGANANAVKELVLCAMLMGSRDVDGGIQWVRQQVASGVDVTTVVEKGKAAFIGPELYKKTLGSIGLGAIGSLVANIALSLGMDVYGYDPFLSVDAALRLDRHIHVVKDINELYKNPAQRAAALQFKENELAEVKPEFSLEITKIRKFADPELNEEFFKMAFPAGNVKTAEEFEAFVDAEISKELRRESDYLFTLQLRDFLLKKAGLTMPVEFLKRWLYVINEGKFTKEEIEKDFDAFVKLKFVATL